VNDVVLAMSAGALRGYLIEQNALPDAPLVAMVPVSMRKRDDADGGGNAVGTVLCNLSTDVADAGRKRLKAISSSMSDNKDVFARLPQVQQLALSAFLTGGLFFGLIPGFIRTVPPPFNIVISNVPGVPGSAVLARCSAGGQLSAVDRAGWPGDEHYGHQQRQQSRLRARRLPSQRSASAAHARTPGDVIERSGTLRRSVTRCWAADNLRPGSKVR